VGQKKVDVNDPRDDPGWQVAKRISETTNVYPMPVPESNGHDLRDDVSPPDDTPQTPVYAEHTLTRSGLLTLPDPEPLIDNVLDQGTTALLYGTWGTAKTFIALDWACSVATGHKWQGRDTEGAFGFKGRVQAWETGWHTKITDDGLHILPRPVDLTRTVEIGNLCALIDWGGYDFIIVDTLARCMVGGDENGAKDCGIVVDTMTRMLKCKPGQLGVHHAGKEGKTLRGSSALESGADTVYFTAREDQVITLDREKRKDGPELDRHELKLALIEGTGSCVIESHSGGTMSGTNFRAKELGLIWSQHFSETGCTSVQLRDVSGMAKTTFYRALSDLLKSREIVNIGTERRPFYARPGNDQVPLGPTLSPTRLSSSHCGSHEKGTPL
jgi:AAA domain